MFRIPLFHRMPARQGGRVKQRRQKLGFCWCLFGRKSSVFFRKSIDHDKTKVPAGSLSLIGRLFEIYFVRLIGTPNQNSKDGINFG